MTDHEGHPTTILEIDGHQFRDLNGNGRLDVYEDSRAHIEDRVENLLQQMRIDEKVGLMFHTPASCSTGSGIDALFSTSTAKLSNLIRDRHINHFNLLMASSAEDVAAWYNRVQSAAERTRLGIPVTLSSDPRHAAVLNPGAGMKLNGFSEWPSQLGLAASHDPDLAETHGRVAGEEYRAIGIRTLLNPMADVATEPRWGRTAGTFGDDFDTASRLTASYVRGFQGPNNGIGPKSVSCMVKHFPGCGPVKEGLEPHFSFGRDQVYPAGMLARHLEPFEAAFKAGARQVMLSYGIPVDQTGENVAMAFNREVVTGILREQMGFEGVVCTDWMTQKTERLLGFISMKEASAWGVEHLTVAERYAKAIHAGVDQFGGQSDPSYLLELVKKGVVFEERIDESARRILRVKFELGLFDNPYVDVSAVTSRAGTPEHRKAGVEAQGRSTVLLTNQTQTSAVGQVSTPILPLGGRPKLYVSGIDAKIAGAYGRVVKRLEEADVAIVAVASPTERKLRKELLSLFFHQGDLRFRKRKLLKILKCCRKVPTVVAVRVDRAPVVAEIADEAAALLATFNVTDEVLMKTLFGEITPTGKLPVEFPRTMRAVAQAPEDAPGTADPLFPRGHGLTYQA